MKDCVKGGAASGRLRPAAPKLYCAMWLGSLHRECYCSPLPPALSILLVELSRCVMLDFPIKLLELISTRDSCMEDMLWADMLANFISVMLLALLLLKLLKDASCLEADIWTD